MSEDPPENDSLAARKAALLANMSQAPRLSKARGSGTHLLALDLAVVGRAGGPEPKSPFVPSASTTAENSPVDGPENPSGSGPAPVQRQSTLRRGHATMRRPSAVTLSPPSAVSNYGKNPVLNNVKSTLGSSGMDCVSRLIRGYRVSAGAQLQKQNATEPALYEFSPESKIWLAKRINRAQQQNKWARWEKRLVSELAMQHRRLSVGNPNVPSGSNLVRSQTAGSLMGSPPAAAKEKKAAKRAIPFFPPVMIGKPSDFEETLSLFDILGHPPFRKNLRHFMEEQFCQENLDFIEVVEEYESHCEVLPSRSLAELKPQELQQQYIGAMQIYEQFIRPSAEQQINIDSKTRTLIEKRLDELTRGLKTRSGSMGALANVLSSFQPRETASAPSTAHLASPKGMMAPPSTAHGAASPRRHEPVPDESEPVRSSTFVSNLTTAFRSPEEKDGADKAKSRVAAVLSFEPRYLFSEAYQGVWKMIESDALKRFTATPQYAEMMATYLEDQLISGNLFKGQGWKNAEEYASIHIDVLGGDFGKEVDAYVVLSMDSKNFKTRAVKGKEVEWAEHFEYPLLSTTQYIEFNVFSSSFMGSDTFLGGVFLPIERVHAQGASVWYMLLARSKGQKAAGGIHLRVALSKEQPFKDPDHVVIAEEKGLSLTDVVRAKVSKTKRRYQDDGFDLDLTYVTEHLIAMGFPSVGAQGLVRNRMADVERFFEKRHPNCYKVYNLCAEHSYDLSHFKGMVANYGFEDHQPPPFLLLPELIEDMCKWLLEHPQNVSAVHCKAGQGRTGVVICSYLIFEQYKGGDAQAALDLFAEKRTENGKGVTVPSQRRYVRYAQTYFANLRQYYKEKFAGLNLSAAELTKHQMRARFPPPSLLIPLKVFYLKSITLHRIPKAVANGTVDVWFQLSQPDSEFSSRGKLEARRDEQEDTISFFCAHQLPIREDVKIEMYYSTLFGKQKMLHCWFNTRFHREGNLIISKKDIDQVHKDKSHKLYAKDTYLEIKLQEVPLEVEETPVGVPDDRRESFAVRGESKSVFSAPSDPKPSSPSPLSSGTVRAPSRHRAKHHRLVVTGNSTVSLSALSATGFHSETSTHLVQRSTKAPESPQRPMSSDLTVPMYPIPRVRSPTAAPTVGAHPVPPVSLSPSADQRKYRAHARTDIAHEDGPGVRAALGITRSASPAPGGPPIEE